jgi:hypothetical protein
MSISAPISTSVRYSPFRVRFWLTPGTVMSDPSTISAAQVGKAAEDGSRGTATVWGRNSGRPVRVMTLPSAVFSTTSSAPNPTSIRSEWSRVGSFSITTVCPGAFSPASSTADFTCAEATGSA